ncbi:FecR family protein [Tistrella mobilis]|uniref:FecR family protein n=1 Tax=Tistrella mobilis TaxID=171437 RepID=UPI0009DA8A65|nr:FecR domain-containing protein [Tistrella mobilis]
MTTRSGTRPSADLLAVAADWLVRLEAAPGDQALGRAFRAWCAADPAHAAAFAEVRRSWLAVPEGLAAMAPPPRVVTRRPRRGRWAAGLTGLAVAAGLAVMLLPGLALRMTADAATGVGELRLVTLADGSRMRLAPLSAADMQLDGNHRRVILRRGEAFFDVVSDAGRPFVVQAGGVQVTVTGTGFEVDRDDDRVTVAVRSGTVRVEGPGVSAVQLSPGEMVEIATDGSAPIRGRIAPDAVALWQDGRLFVDGATVGEVVARLRAYTPGLIIVADDALADREVTGLYDLRDPQAALSALMRAHGGRIRRVGTLLTILDGA